MSTLQLDDVITCPLEAAASETGEVFVMPASFGQERFWVLDQLDPGSSTYNTPAAYRLQGRLNILALEHSLNELVRRHESLRTTFAVIDNQLMQVITPTLALPLPVTDLGHLPGNEREAEALHLAAAEARQPFNLTQGPLVRARLLRLAPTEYIFSLTIHHIISDGWSMAVFWRELSLLYTAFNAGQPSPLPDLPIQYADFALWQREQFQGELLAQELAYWQKQLSGDLPVLLLPSDRPRPAIQTFHGARTYFTLPAPLVGALRSLSQREGATLFMTLLAAFQTLLHRYTGQEDIIVGSPVANRTQAEVEGLIGFFINTLLLRTDLSGRPTFRELLGRVREVALSAYAHQQLPFEKLLEALQPERNRSYNPLFQVLFVLQNTPQAALTLPGLALHPLRLDTHTAKLDVSVSLWEMDTGLTGVIEYNTDLFDASTIERMIGHWQTMSAGIVANPDQPIAALPLLTHRERRQLLAEWNEPPADTCSLETVYELFEKQAARTPAAVAITFENERLTYTELNAKSNQVAHYLKKCGVGPDVCVGLCLERSPEMIIGLLAILKAGGAYVPLDPIYPDERLAFMIKDTRMPVVLTHSGLAARLAGWPASLVCLDTDWPGIAQENRENLNAHITPENLAYVIYTSGSTGQPKGVMIEHRALANFVAAASSAYALNPGDRVLQFASIGFDTSAEEIYPTLNRGATLVLRTDSMLDSVPAFLQKCHEWEITVLDLPTAYWHELTAALATGSLALPEPLRLVIIGGERALPERLHAWHKHAGQRVRLLNTYGPTEATIVATIADVSQPAQSVGEVSIGRPVRNVQAFVLDQNRQPVPVGIPGELYLGGSGLARGYLNQAELTAKKFIPNPFEPAADTYSQTTTSLPLDGQPSVISSRLYKTGDLVRQRLNGEIEFLGRLDHQVKVRGFRIELAEIEAALLRHRAVREAVVTLQAAAHPTGEKRLVAYIVPRPARTPEQHETAEVANSKAGQESLPGELRRFLKEKLPEYMLPAAFVLLPGLPLMPNGKIDYHALPSPNLAEQETNTTSVAPRNELELQLAEIWEQVLGLPTVSVTANFFDLGGHSLLAVRLLTQIEQELGHKLALTALFQAPTIAELAQLLRQAGWSPPASALVLLRARGSRTPLFCIPGNLGNVFTDLKYLVRHLGPDQPVYGLQDSADNPIQIEALAAVYLQEIQAVQPTGPYFLAGICSGGVVAFEMARQLRAQGGQVGLLALIEPSSPPKPGLGPYLRLTKFTLDKIVQRFTRHWRNFSQLDPTAQQDYARLKLKVVGNAWALAAYRAHIYPGRLSLFLTRASLAQAMPDIRLTWQERAAEGMELFEIPGSHDTITGNNNTPIEEAHMQVLAEQLHRCLDQARLELAV